MSYSGDAAEQVVRISLESGEAAVKLAGAGAKQIAVLLYAILRDQRKTKGKTRLSNMLRSGKALKVFAVKDTELQLFCREAKKYGVLYCVLKDRDATDGLTDIMVQAEDASKINRIFARYHLTTVDVGSVQGEAEPAREGQEQPPSQEVPAVDQEAFLDALLSAAPAEEEVPNPTRRQAEKSHPSEPTSEPKGVTGPDTSNRPSVRQELREIRADRRRTAAGKNTPQKQAEHRAVRKKKIKEMKER